MSLCAHLLFLFTYTGGLAPIKVSCGLLTKFMLFSHVAKQGYVGLCLLLIAVCLLNMCCALDECCGHNVEPVSLCLSTRSMHSGGTMCSPLAGCEPLFPPAEEGDAGAFGGDLFPLCCPVECGAGGRA